MKILKQKHIGIILLVFMVLNMSLFVNGVEIMGNSTNSTNMGNNTSTGNDIPINVTKNNTKVTYVSVNGNDSNTGVSELKSKRTIQNAINKALKNNETIIIVKPGVYYENIQIPQGKIIVLNGENATINGRSKGTCISILNGAALQLNGFIITNGTTNYGGGGILNEGNLTIENTTITGNSATNGGGICSYNYMKLHNLSVMNNTAIKNGGGLCICSGNADVSNLTITGNNAADGGGIYNYNYMKLHNLSVMNNTAIKNGGGLYIHNGNEYLNASNVMVTGNKATNGGGIYYKRNWDSFTKFNLEYSTIRDNIAAKDGGGIYAEYSMNMCYCILENNSATNGGGLHAKKAVKTVNCFFKDNIANNGGAVFSDKGYTFVACVFSHNTAIDYGGAIYSPSKKDLAVNNCLFADNMAGIAGGAIALKGGINNYYTSKFINNQFPEIYPIP